MAATYTSALMGLIIPTVGVEVGPQWAYDLNAALEQIDTHNHSPGNGALVPTAGLNIDQDLSFNSYNLTSVNSTRYGSLGSALAGTADKNAVYVIGGNLVYNNSSGVAVQITSGSGLNFASLGVIGGDYGQPGITASVSYSDTLKTYSFTQSPGIGAKMAFSDILLTEAIGSAQVITIKSPTALAGSYSLTMPAALPASKKIMTLTSAGIVAADYDTDNVTVEIASNNLRIKDLGVSTAKLADNSVTTAKIGPTAVTTAKILDANITTDKIANFAVTSGKIADAGVVLSNIANSAVSPAKISSAIFVYNTNNNATASVPFTYSHVSVGNSIWAGQNKVIIWATFRNTTLSPMLCEIIDTLDGTVVSRTTSNDTDEYITLMAVMNVSVVSSRTTTVRTNSGASGEVSQVVAMVL